MGNKVVLVTGSSRGIGKETILKFAKNNYNVVINYLNSEKEAKELEQYVKDNYNVDTLVIKTDVSNEEDIKNMILKIKDKYGHLDVLVNNAGIAIDTLVEDKTKEDFMKILDTNLVGPFLLSREALKIMDKGSIINVSSTNGIDTYYPYSLDYDASKAGLNSLTNNLALHFGPNIRVNAVACGWVLTDMNKELDSEYIKEEENKCILKRFAKPEEIANVIYFLASDEASYINNEIIRVDGGYHG